MADVASSSSPPSRKSLQPHHSSKSPSSPTPPTDPLTSASSSPSDAQQIINARPKPVTVQNSGALAGITTQETAHPTQSPHHPALAIAEVPSNSRTQTASFDLSSAPISIPTARANFDADSTYTPLTPLTARERAPGGYFPYHSKKPIKPQLGTSFAPRYSQYPHPGRHVNYFSDDSRSNSTSSSFDSTTNMHRDRPSSPLSPSAPLSPSPLSPSRYAGNQDTLQAKPRQAPNLQLKSLPRFHPANYESPFSSTETTPRGTRPGTAQPHLRQMSDAQTKLHQYQRDVVVNATRAAALTLSPKATSSPASPRLHPTMGSPGPMTPLALEGGDDYLAPGSQGSPVTQVDRGREIVQRLVDKENERRGYSRRSHSHSPTVSPAGGRG